MPDTISTHLAVALVLGAFVLGYLLAEWYFDGILHKADTKLGECETTITDLVAKCDQYEALLQLQPEQT